MNINEIELKEWCDGARRTLNREREEMMERVEVMNGVVRAMEAVDEILAENESLKSEMDGLRAQLQTERDLRIKAEMQLSEMSKLSAGVAKKASLEEVQKALRKTLLKYKLHKDENLFSKAYMYIRIPSMMNIEPILFVYDYT